MVDPAPTGETASFARYREYLRSLAGNRLDPRPGGDVDPSDVVQETLLKAYRAREQFRGQTEQELAAWLRTILNNTLSNALRSNARAKREGSFRIGEALESSFAQPECPAADGQLQPEEVAVRNEQLLALAAALSRLADEQRVVVEMKHLHGLSVAEISERTGRSKPSVVGLLYRGVKALRVLLDNPNNGTASKYP
jgi:RNA polymerase sigma-70 factor (ECF subfamily)